LLGIAAYPVGAKGFNMKTVIAIPEDTHCGSTLGLILPKQWQRKDGDNYNPNKIQRHIIAPQWAKVWERVAELRKRARLIVVHDGDAVEGTVKTTTKLVSSRNDEQEAIHVDCMDWALKKAKFKPKTDLLYYVEGTDYHVDVDAQSEERIAKDLGAIPFLPPSEPDGHDGKWTHNHLRLNVDGVLFDIAHHGPNPGTRAWTKANALKAIIKSVYFDCLDDGDPIPRIWHRAHFHEFAEATYRGSSGKITGICGPAFQAVTRFGSKMSKATKKASVGMMIYIVENGQVTIEDHFIKVPNAPILRV
jgi:hypothetical protein